MNSLDKSSEKLIILDFDETLFFTFRAIQKAANEIIGMNNVSKEEIRRLPIKDKSKIYDLAYSKYVIDSEPNLKLIKYLETLDSNSKIIVLSAAGIILKSRALELIKKYKIKLDDVIFREDVSEADELWKLREIKKLSEGYGHVDIFEDKIDNIEYIRKNVPAGTFTFYLVTKDKIETC